MLISGLYYVVFILLFGDLILGYPDGAPERACFFMIPRHTHPQSGRPIFAQTGGSPYNITVSSYTYSINRPIRVTISGAPFKGFLLVAAEEGSKDWPTGAFYTENSAARPMWCSSKNDAITHSNDRWKDSITVLWYGPTFSSADMIQFQATVVTNRTTYWTNIKSGHITQDASAQEAQGENAQLTSALGFGGFGQQAVDAWGYPTTDAWGWGGGMARGMSGGMSSGMSRSSGSRSGGSGTGDTAPGEGVTGPNRSWGRSRGFRGMNFLNQLFNPFFWRRRK